MAKLFLRYEGTVLQELNLAHGVVTIGRLADNLIPIENLAVSSHHARILWQEDHYVLEDNNSLNGTHINNRRINRAALKDGDVILIGRHTLVFKDDPRDAKPRVRLPAPPVLSGMDETLVMDAKVLESKLMGAGNTETSKAGEPQAGTDTAAFSVPQAPPPTGVVTVLSGNTDRKEYLLTEKLAIIGGAKISNIRIRGWFVPDVLAVIARRGHKYFVSPQKKDSGAKLNGQPLNGQQELKDGDMLQVRGAKLIFGLRE